jgi:hypothetical protein
MEKNASKTYRLLGLVEKSSPITVQLLFVEFRPLSDRIGMKLPSCARKGVAYVLNNALYLSVTNRAPCTGLIATRGPGFIMPAESGFVLLPVEGAEGGGPYEPTAAELAAAVEEVYADLEIVGMGENDAGVSFTGAGDPLLRVETVLETAALVKQRRHGISFSVTTSGLFCPSVPAALHAGGVTSVTVALNAADPKVKLLERRRLRASARPTDQTDTPQAALQATDHYKHCSNSPFPPPPPHHLHFTTSFRPVTASPTPTINPPPYFYNHLHPTGYLLMIIPKTYARLMAPTNDMGFQDVCSFVLAAAEAGMDVTCAAVDAPGVKLADVRQLASSLGARQFKVRPYFP